MTSPYRVRTRSNPPGARAGSWFAAVVAGARSAGLVLLMAGLVSLAPGVSPAWAGSEDATWVVTETSGDVQYRMGGKAPTAWGPLHVGAALGATAEVRTGGNSRALLTHRGTTLSVSPESSLKLPGADRPNGVYRVFQSLGTLLYRIKERAAGMAAFEVETPYLVALVKGTVFTVNASADGAAVHLTEGIVDVQPTLGGTGATLTPGRTARITAVPGADVIVKGQDAGKRSTVIPPKGKGKGKSNAATPAGADAHGGKGVTISTMAKSEAGPHVRHPRAVAIFAGNNRDGLFAKGVKVKNAFNKKDGALGSSNHGARVRAVARDLAINGGADVSAKAMDGGLVLGTGHEGSRPSSIGPDRGGLSGGVPSSIGPDGGGLSGGGGHSGGGPTGSGSLGGGGSLGGSPGGAPGAGLGGAPSAGLVGAPGAGLGGPPANKPGKGDPGGNKS